MSSKFYVTNYGKIGIALSKMLIDSGWELDKDDPDIVFKTGSNDFNKSRPVVSMVGHKNKFKENRNNKPIYYLGGCSSLAMSRVIDRVKDIVNVVDVVVVFPMSAAKYRVGSIQEISTTHILNHFHQKELEDNYPGIEVNMVSHLAPTGTEIVATLFLEGALEESIGDRLDTLSAYREVSGTDLVSVHHTRINENKSIVIVRADSVVLSCSQAIIMAEEMLMCEDDVLMSGGFVAKPYY